MKHVIPLLIMCAVTGVLLFGYVIMYGRVASGVARAEVALERSKTLGERDAAVRSQQAFLEDTTRERSELDAFVTRDADIIAVIEIVENTARREGVETAISTIATLDKGWVYHEAVVVNFSAAGTFSELAQFMSALETLPLAASLSQASLEVSTGSEWFGTFSVVFVKKK